MFKLSAILLIVSLVVFPVQAQSFYENDPLDNMPILKKLPANAHGASPIEQRSAEFKKFLAASVRIDVSFKLGNKNMMGSGSGTIIYYDSAKNLAYVASCGHLWDQGTLSEEQAKTKKLKCKILIWYHNDVKLESPISYDADVLFYSYMPGQDTSLLSFTPDWIPDYFPIAPKNYSYVSGKHVHSLGSDNRTEAAHYDVEIIELAGGDLVTMKNSPRPGRSGGGLMDDDGYYIGTCWGTEFKDGSGKGFFTPLSAIHSYWSKQKSYAFLLDQKPGQNAKNIPVRDRMGNKKFGPEYILIPGRN